MKVANAKKSFLFIFFALMAVNLSAASAGKYQPERTKVAKKYYQLKEKANKDEKVRVIAKLKGADTPKLRHKNKAVRKALLNKNTQKLNNIKSYFNKNNINHIRDIERLGYAVLEVDSSQLDELIDSGLVESVIEDELSTVSLETSIPQIGANIAHASGYTGAGQAVVIFDNGFDTSHPSFGGRVVEEACFSTGSSTKTSLCPNGENSQIGVGASTGCGPTSNGCYHGTHVAATAAGVNGVAPEADIITVQVFYYSESAGKNYATTSDLIAALEWVLNDATTENIASINMSLGGSTEYFTNCDTDSRAPTIAALREAGIATVVSSGNDGFSVGLQSPACISDTISVGGTDEFDVVRTSSNSSELVDMLAPGTRIYAATPGNTYSSYSGTSMASPHVAGAFAVFRSVDPTASVTTIETMLEGSGVEITDADNGVTKPRIDVNAAIKRYLAAKNEPLILWPNGIDAVASAAQDAHPAVNVGDGDISTRWSAQSAGQTITFDLGDTYSLSEIQIAFLKGDSRSTYFDLAISFDGTTFTTVATGLESSGSSNALESFELSGAAQYVRIIGQGNSSNNWNSITEVEIVGADITVIPDSIDFNNLSRFDAAQGSQTLNVSANVSWTITSDDDWISVSPSSGINDGSSIITVTENVSLEVRRGWLTLSGGSITMFVSVTQSAAQLINAPTDLNVAVTNVGEITVSWNDTSDNETGFLIEYAPYEGDENRPVTFDSIIVDANSTSVVINDLVKDGYYVQVSSFNDELSSDYAIDDWTYVEYLTSTLVTPEDFTVEVTAAGELTLNWTDLSTGEAGYLLQFARYRAETGYSIYSFTEVLLPEDTTSYTITDLDEYWYYVRISAFDGDSSSDYAVEERKFVQFEVDDVLTVSTSSLNFAASASIESVTINSNVDWTVSDDASWLSASITTGLNNSIVTFTADENTSTASRSATITVTGGSITQTIGVTQNGAFVSNEPILLTVVDASSSSNDGNVVANTLDDDLDTRWSANGDGEYATYDLGADKLVSAVNIAFFKGDSRNTFVSIQVSDNGTDFSTVLSNVSSRGDSLNLEEFVISTQARYVRIIGHGNSSNSWNSLTEVQIWGTEL